MTVPVIRPLPPAPVRADAPADFSAKADAFAASLAAFVDDVNGSASFIDQRAADADTRATDSADSAAAAAQAKTDAELARDAAQSVASFKGSWSSLTGAISVPATVLHNDQIWSLLANLADVATSEPGVSADWVVQGGIDASKTADFTASRNAAYWIDSSLTVTLPAADTPPKGTFVDLWIAQGVTVPVFGGGAFQIKVAGASAASVSLNRPGLARFVWDAVAWQCVYAPFAITAEVDAAIMPLTGAVIAFARSTAPDGWLKANGALVSRQAYARLFSAIGTTFGSGDGSTTFALPDLRGEFVRGWADGKAVDTGRVLGSAQADALKAHTHSVSAATNYGYTSSSQGSAGTGSTSTVTGSTGDTETRPRNIALLYCIKY